MAILIQRIEIKIELYCFMIDSYIFYCTTNSSEKNNVCVYNNITLAAQPKMWVFSLSMNNSVIFLYLFK